MRIVANLFVKDEAELVGRTVAHLRAIGVDAIVACDMYSSDGSAEILERFARDADVTLIQLSDQLSLEAWTNRTLGAVRELEPDWIVFLDADEFPLPATGNLKDCRALDESDVLRIDRFNVPLTRHGPALPPGPPAAELDRLMLITRPIRNYWTRSQEAPWIMGRVAPKVMARASRMQTLTLAGHDVEGTPGPQLRRSEPPDLITAHVPFSTRSRFERKVANIRQKLAADPDLFAADQALHWRRWAGFETDGELAREFERMALSDADLAQLQGDGVVQSAAELFQARLAHR